MKKLIRLFPLVILGLLLFACQLGAQTPEFPNIADLTPQNIFDATMEPLFGVLVIGFGYLSAYIPGLKNWSPFYRVLTFALVAGLGFYLFGKEFWKLAFTYFISSGLYDVFLKKIFKTPKPPALTR